MAQKDQHQKLFIKIENSFGSDSLVVPGGDKLCWEFCFTTNLEKKLRHGDKTKTILS